MTGSRIDSDVVIAGGGLAGLPLGLALARGGLSVAVVDTGDPAAALTAEFDGRASSIAHASGRMLGALGVMRHLDGQLQPINDILVTDGTVRGGAAPFFLHFDHAEIGDEPLGHMVENRHLRIALQAEVDVTEGLTVYAPAAIASLETDNQAVTAVLDDGTEIRAAVCVAADGRNSARREAVGIKTIGWGYDQAGIVATIEHERSHGGVAQELFLPSGPFAILPLTGNRASLVWSERTEIAQGMMALDNEQFADEVRMRVGDHLGHVEPMGPRWSYPLTLQLARDYVAPRLALVGDAAHVIHPIAGQGLNMGLRDVAALAEVLVETRRLGLDIGSVTALERYQRWRRFDNVALAVVTDGLNRLFSNDVGPVRLIRDLGLGAVNRIGPLRRFFMREAGGATGELPRLMRGEGL